MPTIATDVSALDPTLALIAAVAANGVIGADNRMPWHLPADLKHFRALTQGHTVIMGRRTWESLSRPLPERQNIILTRNASFFAAGAEIALTLDDAMARACLPAPVFCIGGGEIYRMAITRANKIFLTEIERDFAGDAYFPPVDPQTWRESGREMGATAEFRYHFVTYERRAG